MLLQVLVALPRRRRALTCTIPDIKSLTLTTPNLVNEIGPAFEKYNEEQFATVKLPGSSQQVIISSHCSLGDGRYYDVESSSSFAFDHTTQVSRVQAACICLTDSNSRYRELAQFRAMCWKVLCRTWCKRCPVSTQHAQFWNWELTWI
jgi:hypothetical protein